MSAQVASHQNHDASAPSAHAQELDQLSIDEVDAIIADRIREYSNEIYIWTHRQWTDWRAKTSPSPVSSASSSAASTPGVSRNHNARTGGGWTNGGDIDGDKFHLYYDGDDAHDEPGHVNSRAKTTAVAPHGPVKPSGAAATTYNAHIPR